MPEIAINNPMIPEIQMIDNNMNTNMKLFIFVYLFGVMYVVAFLDRFKVRIDAIDADISDTHRNSKMLSNVIVVVMWFIATAIPLLARPIKNMAMTDRMAAVVFMAPSDIMYFLAPFMFESLFSNIAD